jgi:two-component system response regulator (stage 0 sporulation protein F)
MSGKAADGKECEPLSILVIDDDPGIRRLLLETLHQECWLVVAVGSAEEGLAQLPYTNFAVAFVDHVLPGMDGLTLCGYLRRANPLIEVVLMTGEESPRLRHAALEEGVRFLSKPLTLAEILRVVKEQQDALRQRAVRSAVEDPDFAPRLHTGLLEEVARELDLPPVPDRLKEALIQRLRDCLVRMRSKSRYLEKDRLALFSGIVAARLLGISLPTVMDGRLLAEEYDRLMLRMGKRPEFTTVPDRPMPTCPDEASGSDEPGRSRPR